MSTPPSLAPFLCCPLDGSPLRQDERRLLCLRGHSFDLARQGYVNLLPVQHKHSRHPGDSKEMVLARQRFLNSGVYAPIAKLLQQRVTALLPVATAPRILDAGCGEGYYLDRLWHDLPAPRGQGKPLLVGLDISKEAIIAATKRNQNITWLVASNRRPPVLPASLDLIVCLFGFPLFEAFQPLLRPTGKLLLLDPGEEHLLELRELIYPEVRKSGPPSLDEALAMGLRQAGEARLRYQTPDLDPAQIQDLLTMTPHMFRASYEGKQRAQALQSIRLTVDVVVRELELDLARQPG